MATVTGLTAERMAEIEDASIVDGNVVGGNLILVTNGGANINAGSVIGPIGPAGASFIVCTSTTRPSLSAGEAGKAIYETDTKLIRIWIGTRWRLQEKVVCTSTTRPVVVAADAGVKIAETDSGLEYTWDGTTWRGSAYSPFGNSTFRAALWPAPLEGALSYLNDVDRFEVYNGTAWVDTSTVGKSPRGEIGVDESFSNTGAIGASWTLFHSVTVNVKNGRRYRAHAHARCAPASVSLLQYAIRVGPSPAAFGTGTQLSLHAFNTTLGGMNATAAFDARYLASADTVMVFQLWAWFSNPAGVLGAAQDPHFLHVYDEGMAY